MIQDFKQRKRVNLHGAVIGTGHYNQLVRLCDARWWQVWRWIEYVSWCFKAKQWPMTLKVPYMEIGEVVTYYVVLVGELKGVPSEKASVERWY